MAITQYVDSSENETVQMSVSEAVEKLWHEILRPAMPNEATRFFGDAWRRERLYTQGVDDILAKHDSALQEVFGVFAVDSTNKAHHSGFKNTLHMNFREWNAMLTESMLWMHALPLSDLAPDVDIELAALVFSCAKMYVRDPLVEYSQQQHLTYHEFVEAVCRLADVVDIPDEADYTRAQQTLTKTAHDLGTAATAAIAAADTQRTARDGEGGAEGSEASTTPSSTLSSTPLEMASRMAARRSSGVLLGVRDGVTAAAAAVAAAAAFAAASASAPANDVSVNANTDDTTSAALLQPSLVARYWTGRLLSATHILHDQLAGRASSAVDEEAGAAKVARGSSAEDGKKKVAGSAAGSTHHQVSAKSAALAVGISATAENHMRTNITSVALPEALRPAAVPCTATASSTPDNALVRRVHTLLPLLLLGARYKLKHGTVATHRHTVAADMTSATKLMSNGGQSKPKSKRTAIATSLARLGLKDADLLAYDSARQAWEAVGGKKVSLTAEPNPIRKAAITVMPTARMPAGVAGLTSKGLMAKQAALKFKTKLLGSKRHTTT
jgi:hypothetical protein